MNQPPPEGKSEESMADETDERAISDTNGAADSAMTSNRDSGSAVQEVEVEAYAILGTTSMPVSQLLRMGRGAVVELDTNVGDQIEIKVNDLLIARGEIVVVQDRIAVEIREIIKRDQD